MVEGERPSLAARLADAIGDEYTIQGEIGRGGMGVVYLARDLKLDRRVAIKVLPPDLAYRSEIRTRFMREARTAAGLSHPHIVPIHTVGEADGLVYFVMGYVDGESLGARLKRRGKLPIEEVRRIMKETADALGLAHTMGIIHRDVKPDNILLDGTRRRVMVTDFGIAKALEAGSGTLTGTGVAIGTPTYMSPEQAAGDREIDARTDVYALGVVAYEMITGRVPFKAPTVPGILMKQMTERPPEILSHRPECPDELANTVMRCLEKDPEHRWPTADSLRRALDSRSSGSYRPAARRGGTAARAREGVVPPRSRKRASGGEPDWPERPRPSRRSSRGGRDEGDARPRPPVRGRDRKRADAGKEELALQQGEPKILTNFRSGFASYVSVNGSLLLLALVTPMPMAVPIVIASAWGVGLASQYGKLWTAGYSWRDVVDRPPAADSVGAPPVAGPRGGRAQLPSPVVREVEYGGLTSQVKQVLNDRKAIFQIVDRLPESERKLLPDIMPTVDALMTRATELAKTLSQMEGEVDARAVHDLDRRITELEEEGAGRERDRRLDLLRRQRQTLSDLVHRRTKVEAQFESCVLAIQNMRFDLLRLRSAGVAAVLDDLTMVTQQAKALNQDINAAIEAAGEIREVLGRGTPGT